MCYVLQNYGQGGMSRACRSLSVFSMVPTCGKILIIFCQEDVICIQKLYQTRTKPDAPFLNDREQVFFIFKMTGLKCEMTILLIFCIF